MPPRRSTRARASVEPSPTPSAAPASRKRTRSTPTAPDPEKTRARSRTASGRSTVARIKEEPEADSPPVKKSRPSPETSDSEEEQDEDEEEDDYEEEEVKPKGRGRKSASSTASSKAKKATASKGRASRKVETPEDSDEEVPPPARASKGTAAPARSRKVIALDAEEEGVQEEEEESPCSTRRGKGARTSAGSTKVNGNAKAAPRRQPAKADDSEDDAVVPDSEQSGDDSAPPAGSNGRKAQPSKPQATPIVQLASDSEDDAAMAEVTAVLDDDDDGPSTPPVQNLHLLTPAPVEEEEKSLLEPEPPRPPPSPSKTKEERAAEREREEKAHGPQARLVIHKMALVNFKSYAGRQEIGPFHKSFSAIVGPNGSGKSNTIDALLFVFGYRASKMRQGKLSELIHNSARYQDLQECAVEVHFREIIDLPGPDAFKVVPNSELVVARTAYRNNSSKYTINGCTSSFTEVQALLKARGIDLDHKRFLILQGEVESIAQMKPKAPTEHEDGLLEYLEDIIGTSKYKTPIEEALAGVDTLSEERGEKLGRLRIVEREKRRLEEGKKEAEAWLRMQNDFTRARSRLWQWFVWKCLNNDKQYAAKLAKLEEELAQEVESNRADVEHQEQLEKHYEGLVQAYEDLKIAASDVAKDLAVEEKKLVQLEERKKHAKTKAKKLQKQIKDDEKAKDEAGRTIEDSTEKMAKEKQKLEEYEESLEKEEKILEGIRDSLKDKTQVFHDQIEVKQRELQPWMAKINIKKSEIDVATSERDALSKKAETIREQAQQAADALQELKDDHESKVTQLNEAQANRSNLQRDIKAGEKRVQDAQARVQSLRSKASSARQKFDEAKASQTANASQGKVLDSLNRLKSQGRAEGFHGRLGSLGTIPDKYDVAVSTACGALNNLVVDTVDQGQALIEYLRKQNIGRANFLVLEKLSSQGLEKIQTPENVPRLIDLIKPKEPRFAPAFFKGVYNTLVAQNMDQANRIAFGNGSKRWRIVTLAGELIDASGTMSGGGTTVAKGLMSSKLATDAVSPQTLKVYEQESEKATQELEDAMHAARNAENELDGYMQSGPKLDLTIEKIDLDVKNIVKRIAEAEKRIRDLKLQSKPDATDAARISALETQITATAAELEDLESKSGKVEKAIKDLEKKILEVGGSKLLTQKSKVDGIRLHINIASEEMTKAEVAKAKAEKDLKKFSCSIKTNTPSLEEAQSELEKLDDDIAEADGIASASREKLEAANSAAENQKDNLATLKVELDEKTEQIQAFRQTQLEYQQMIADTKKERAENDKTLHHWETEHEKLALEDIDSDDEEEEDAPEKEVGGVAPSTEQQSMEAEGDERSAPQPQPSRRSDDHELVEYGDDELATFKRKEMIAEVELLDEKLKNARPNMNVLKEYRKREEEFLNRAKDLERITALRDEQKTLYDGLCKQRLDEFMAGFSLISMKLKEMYQMITLGGNAELELVDSMDPFSEGIIFSVMPPKKSWKNISNLSGGEKTLSSLALVFALHVFKPTPLYFMDEIDAALDFRNVSIVANYIKDRTKNAQFIIISLRNDMFELSHRLIGIYKTANATRSISIDNHALTAVPITIKSNAAA